VKTTDEFSLFTNYEKTVIEIHFWFDLLASYLNTYFYCM